MIPAFAQPELLRQRDIDSVRSQELAPEVRSNATTRCQQSRIHLGVGVYDSRTPSAEPASIPSVLRTDDEFAPEDCALRVCICFQVPWSKSHRRASERVIPNVASTRSITPPSRPHPKQCHTFLSLEMERLGEFLSCPPKQNAFPALETRMPSLEATSPIDGRSVFAIKCLERRIGDCFSQPLPARYVQVGPQHPLA